MTNLLTSNQELVNYLDQAGVMDASDGEVFAKTVVITNDTLQNFKDAAKDYNGEEVKVFGDIKLTNISNYQKFAGQPRQELYYVDFQNSEQNIVIIY